MKKIVVLLTLSSAPLMIYAREVSMITVPVISISTVQPSLQLVSSLRTMNNNVISCASDADNVFVEFTLKLKENDLQTGANMSDIFAHTVQAIDWNIPVDNEFKNEIDSIPDELINDMQQKIKNKMLIAGDTYKLYKKRLKTLGVKHSDVLSMKKKYFKQQQEYLRMSILPVFINTSKKFLSCITP